MSIPQLSSHQNPHSCTEVKKNVIAITAALSAITLLGSVLTILAMQGIQMGPFNTIPSLIGEGGVYGFLLGSAVLLTADLVLMCSMIRHKRPKEPLINPLPISSPEPTRPLKFDEVEDYLRDSDASSFDAEDQYSIAKFEIEGQTCHLLFSRGGEDGLMLKYFDSFEAITSYTKNRPFFNELVEIHEIFFEAKPFIKGYASLFSFHTLYPNEYLACASEGGGYYCLISRDETMCHTEYFLSDARRQERIAALQKFKFVDHKEIERIWSEHDLASVLTEEHLHSIVPLNDHWSILYDMWGYALIPSDELGEFKAFVETRSIDSEAQIESAGRLPNSLARSLVERISSAPMHLHNAVQRMSHCEYYPLDLKTRNEHYSTIYLLLIKDVFGEQHVYPCLSSEKRAALIAEKYHEWKDASKKELHHK